MKAINVKDEKFVLPLWAEEKFREILMLCNTKGPMRVELQAKQSLYFSESESLKGSEGFVDVPWTRSTLKFMYMGDNHWTKYDTSGEVNVIKQQGMKK